MGLLIYTRAYHSLLDNMERLIYKGLPLTPRQHGMSGIQVPTTHS